MADSTQSTEAAARIVELIDRLGRRVRARRKVGDLNELQWQVLRFLTLGNRYARSPGGIATGLGITKGAASQAVEALAKQGLILRLPDPRDGRGLALDLTNGGRRMAETDPLRTLARALAPSPAALLDATAATLAAALGALAPGKGGDATGHCTDCRHFRPDDARGETGGPHRCGRTAEALNAAELELVCTIYEANVPA